MNKKHFEILTTDMRYLIVADTDSFEPTVYNIWLFATEKYPKRNAIAELRFSSSGELIEAIDDDLTLYSTYKVGDLVRITHSQL